MLALAMLAMTCCEKRLQGRRLQPDPGEMGKRLARLSH
jgi:hypothetical protein